jgi:hypothetical protein
MANESLTSWNGRPVVLVGDTDNDRAKISREFQAQHALLERRGVLDHTFGPTDDRDMFPVRRWDGRRFVELKAVPVAR